MLVRVSTAMSWYNPFNFHVTAAEYGILGVLCVCVAMLILWIVIIIDAKYRWRRWVFNKSRWLNPFNLVQYLRPPRRLTVGRRQEASSVDGDERA
jgi:hypothetical protein